MQLSVDDSDTHRAASATNLALSSFQGVYVQIGQLGLSDLGDLSLGDGANLLLVGTPEPDSRPMAFMTSRGVGGVLVMKVKERSAYTVMTTGIL